MFREGRFTGDVFTLTFADKGTWVFNSLGATVAPGKISTIACYSGGACSASYAATGRLASVSDSFGHSLTLDWLSGGTLSSVTDPSGRSVYYTRYGAGEAGGGEGDLKSASCPQLVGSPPVAGDTVYAYTKGFADDQRNHNLLSINDGAGRLIEAFTYSTATSPTDIDYDACASHDRHKKEYTGHVTLMKREMAPPAAEPPGSYTTFEVDEIGRLTEFDCDRLHRVLHVRQFTGFCTAGTPVTSTTNRPNPASRVRSTDPEFFESQFDYNADGLCTVATLPDGSQGRWTYDRDLRTDCPVPERGNARVCTIRSPGGEERTVAIEYKPGFGSTEEAARPGGPIKGIQVKCGRNPGGDVVAAGLARPGGPIKGISVKCGRNPGGDVVAQARASIAGITAGAVAGIVVAREPGALFKEEGGRHTPFHNKYRPQFSMAGGLGVWDGGEEGGGCTDTVSRFQRLRDRVAEGVCGFVVNSHSSPFDLSAASGDGKDDDCDSRGDDEFAAAAKPRKARHKGWDGLIYGSHRMASFPIRVTTAHGQVYTWSYDAKGNCTGTTSPVSGAGTQASYDALGRCTGMTVLDGPGSSFHDAFTYDASSGFLSSIVCDESGLALTTAIERDSVGRITRVVDPRGHDYLYEYNPLDQVTVARLPDLSSVPSRISTNFTYDAGGRLVRCDVEHRGADGSLDAANPAYTTFVVRDERCRVTRVATEERPVTAPPGVVTPDSLGISNFGVCDVEYDDAGQCSRLEHAGRLPCPGHRRGHRIHLRRTRLRASFHARRSRQHLARGLRDRLRPGRCGDPPRPWPARSHRPPDTLVQLRRLPPPGLRDRPDGQRDYFRV